MIEEAQDDGVYLFGEGIRKFARAVLMPNASVTTEICPGTEIWGGFTIFELPQSETQERASRMTVACLCTQELRESCRLTAEHHLANALPFGAVQVVAVLDQGAAFLARPLLSGARL